MSDKFRPTVILPIPGIPGDCPVSLAPLLDAVKNNLETGIGERAKPTGIDYDQWVRIRDLTDQSFWRSIGSPLNDLFGTEETTDTTPPGEPTSFTVVTGEAWANFLSWTNPTDSDFSYIEVWGSRTNDIGLAVQIDNVSYPMATYTHLLYNDLPGDWFYWIRAVDYSGNKSDFVGSGVGDEGYEVPGENTIGKLIDAVMEALQGYQAEFSIYSAITTYYYGDRVVYDSGDGVDRTYKAVIGGGGNFSGIPPIDPVTGLLNSLYWLRSGLLIEGDVDGVATVGIDGNTVIDGTLLARSIATDQLIVGDNITIENGAIHIAHIGDDNAILNENQDWDDIGGAGKADDNADVTEDQFAETLANIDSGTGRALAGFNASSQITKAVKASLMAGTPDAAGLWLTSTHLGYYSGSEWPVYIKNDGDFWFGKDANNYFAYTGGNLVFSTNQSGAFWVLEGGDINLQSTGANPSRINWYGSGYDIYMGRYPSGSMLAFQPETQNYGGVIIGGTITSGANKQFYSINFNALTIVDTAYNLAKTSYSQVSLSYDRMQIRAPYIRGVNYPNIGSTTTSSKFGYGYFAYDLSARALVLSSSITMAGALNCDDITMSGILSMTGDNIFMDSTWPYIQIENSATSKKWVIVNTGTDLQIRENNISTVRVKFKPGGNVDIDGVLAQNAWSIDLDKGDDIWEMAESIQSSFTNHHGKNLHSKLKHVDPEDDKISYVLSDFIQILTECVMDLKQSLPKKGLN